MDAPSWPCTGEQSHRSRRIAEVQRAISILESINLRSLREYTGLTMHDMVDRMGVTIARIGAIERADNLRMDTVVRYLKALS